MSDLIISARIIQHGPRAFIVMVSSAAAEPGGEDSASDLLTAEVDTKRRAEECRDALIGQAVEAADRRGHNIVRVDRSEAWQKK
jgi:hypothetical protein